MHSVGIGVCCNLSGSRPIMGMYNDRNSISSLRQPLHGRRVSQTFSLVLRGDSFASQFFDCFLGPVEKKVSYEYF